MHKVLIIDDEPDIRELLELTLTRMGNSSTPCETKAEALVALGNDNFDLCLTDMNLPDGTGLEIVKHIQETQPELPIAVITAYGSMELAIESLKAGAFDFVSKPVELDRLRSLIQSALKVKEDIPSQSQIQPHSRLTGSSEKMSQLRNTIIKLARSQAPVYIHGESGSGKELVANEIHAHGPRAEQPFIAVNCGAIPSELMESEFFGHKKGSFTGATADKEGLFMAANGGTLFLDEVADLPQSMQVKLLRAIQERAIKPIGEHSEVNIDVRILSATHKDLNSEVEAGRFRQDLFYRLSVIPLNVPSLRERKEDVPELVDLFMQRIAETWNTDVKMLTNAAKLELQEYSFPGNVRELENILERTVTLTEGNTIDASELALPHTQNNESGKVATETKSAAANNIQTPSKTGLLDNLADNERNAIIAALEDNRWNRTAAAKQLGLTLRQLRYRLEKLDIM